MVDETNAMNDSTKLIRIQSQKNKKLLSNQKEKLNKN